MKKINVICVGKIKEKFLIDGIAEYSKRLTRYAQVSVCELTDFATDNNVCKQKESGLILAKLKGYVILLDLEGKMLTSEQFAKEIDKAYISNSEITLIIGGSRGVDERVKQRADLAVAFGKITYPHQLMRLILFEQTYRAFTIIEGTPYHK